MHVLDIQLNKWVYKYQQLIFHYVTIITNNFYWVSYHLGNLPLEAHGLGAHYSVNEEKDDGY